MEAAISHQKYNLLSSLIDFEKENKSKYACSCTGTCRINHKVHNWSKPKFVEILNKTRNSLGMQVKCERCDDEFVSFADLEKTYSKVASNEET